MTKMATMPINHDENLKRLLRKLGVDFQEISIQWVVVLVLRLVGCFGLNGPLRQYFSLYQAVSQREGERKEK